VTVPAITDRRSALIQITSNRLVLKARLFLSVERTIIYNGEAYAHTHADWSPMSEVASLPGGRKRLYYEIYYHDRATQGLRPGTYAHFLRVWRCDLFWLHTFHSQATFSKCGICQYLRAQLDSIPRSLVDARTAIRGRLFRHYEFQGQRGHCYLDMSRSQTCEVI